MDNSTSRLSKPRIIASACKLGHVMVIGPRHWDKTMVTQYNNMKNCDAWKAMATVPPTAYFSEGFIDQHGEYYDRKQAMVIVKASGQAFDKKRNGDDDKELYSEGIY